MDPYSAVFNDHLDPSYLDDDVDDTVPDFDMQYTMPSINYYQIRRSENQTPESETSTNAAPPPQPTVSPQSTGCPQPSSSNTNTTLTAPQISLIPQPDITDIDFMDDSFDIQIANINDPAVEGLLKDISENTLQEMADNNERFRTRFQTYDDNERSSFIEERENKNTKRKMNYAVKTFQEFLLNLKSEYRQIQQIPPPELDKYLQEFYIGIRKETKGKNVTEIDRHYQPSSLHGFQCMLNRFLRLNDYGYDLSKSTEFQKSRDCLAAKKKHLKEMGLGNRPNAAEALESEDEEELFNSGGFGVEDADSLIRTLWYMNTVHFGLRGSHEHRQLQWGDIKLDTDATGKQCLIYNERVTKTRDGSNIKNTRAYAPKSWSNPGDERKCHVSVYLKYRLHRPNDDPDTPFYLGVNRIKNAKSWYRNQPLGEKTLNTFMKKAVEKTNIDPKRKLTNHSGRKTTVTRLLDEGIPITAIQQHTGHRSVESINNYAKNSLKTQQKMSSILSRAKPSNATDNVQVMHMEETNHTGHIKNNHVNSSTTTCSNMTKEQATTQSGTNNNHQLKESAPATCMNRNNNAPVPTENQPGNKFNIPFVFPSGTIIQGGTFNLYFGGNDKENENPVPPKKRRACVIASDSDSD